MKDPYSVLGVKASAGDDEIRKAYRALVKKYHPDRYAGSPMEAQAQEKLKEINTAYDQVQKIRSGEAAGPGAAHTRHGGAPFTQNWWDGGYYEEPGTAGGDVRFNDIREMINKGLIYQAESALERMSDRPAQWHYLMGVVCFRKGQYDFAQQYFSYAAQMDPTNAEYQRAAQRMNQAYAQRAHASGVHFNAAACENGRIAPLMQCLACCMLSNLCRCGVC